MKKTNDDKAKEIIKKLPFSSSASPIYKDYAYDAAIQMAKWKDEQFDKKLAEEQKRSYRMGHSVGRKDIVTKENQAYVRGAVSERKQFREFLLRLTIMSNFHDIFETINKKINEL